MSIPQVSGPCYMYIARPSAFLDAIPSTAELFFLGTCEQPPTIQLNPQWEPVMNDIGGSLLPIDYSYQGEDGLVSGTLNKWNELVYLQLSSHGLASGVSTRGVEILGVSGGAGGDIGKLSQTESMAFQLWMQFPYSGKTIFGTTNNMPAGYHFWVARLAGHVIGPGTRANRRQLILHADRAMLETNVASTSKFSLYDHTFTATVDGSAGTNIWPAVPPTGPTGRVSTNGAS